MMLRIPPNLLEMDGRSKALRDSLLAGLVPPRYKDNVEAWRALERMDHEIIRLSRAKT